MSPARLSYLRLAHVRDARRTTTGTFRARGRPCSGPRTSRISGSSTRTPRGFLVNTGWAGLCGVGLEVLLGALHPVSSHPHGPTTTRSQALNPKSSQPRIIACIGVRAPAAAEVAAGSAQSVTRDLRRTGDPAATKATWKCVAIAETSRAAQVGMPSGTQCWRFAREGDDGGRSAFRDCHSCASFRGWGGRAARVARGGRGAWAVRRVEESDVLRHTLPQMFFFVRDGQLCG